MVLELWGRRLGPCFFRSVSMIAIPGNWYAKGVVDSFGAEGPVATVNGGGGLVPCLAGHVCWEDV